MIAKTFDYGREGELCIQEYFLRHGYNVEDLSSDSAFQTQDIDMRIQKPGDASYTVEVKTDTKAQRTGNIIIETAMDRKTGTKPGWFHYCHADILCYFIPSIHKAYFLDWPMVRKLVIAGVGKPCTFKNPIDPNCIGHGQLLNIERDLKTNHAILWESIIACKEPKKYAVA